MKKKKMIEQHRIRLHKIIYKKKLNIFLSYLFMKNKIKKLEIEKT